MSTDATKIRIAFPKNGSKAVIMRQGPAKWTRMLVWDTRTDELEPGQWIRSKIPNFDINSDGSMILAFVQSYRARHEHGTWVALSRPPWFTALAIWKIGDSWGGQCSFVTDRKIYVGAGIHEPILEGRLGKGFSWSSKPPIPDTGGWRPEGEGASGRLKKPSARSGLTVACVRRRSGFEVTIEGQSPPPGAAVIARQSP